MLKNYTFLLATQIILLGAAAPIFAMEGEAGEQVEEQSGLLLSDGGQPAAPQVDMEDDGSAESYEQRIDALEAGARALDQVIAKLEKMLGCESKEGNVIPPRLAKLEILVFNKVDDGSGTIKRVNKLLTFWERALVVVNKLEGGSAQGAQAAADEQLEAKDDGSAQEGAQARAQRGHGAGCCVQ